MFYEIADRSYTPLNLLRKHSRQFPDLINFLKMSINFLKKESLKDIFQWIMGTLLQKSSKYLPVQSRQKKH